MEAPIEAPTLGTIMPEVHYLKNANKALQRKVDILTQHIFDNGTELNKAQTSELNNYAEQMASKLKTVRKLYEGRKKELSRLEQRLREAKEEVAFLQFSKIRYLQTELNVAKRRIDVLQKERDELKDAQSRRNASPNKEEPMDVPENVGLNTVKTECVHNPTASQHEGEHGKDPLNLYDESREYRDEHMPDETVRDLPITIKEESLN